MHHIEEDRDAEPEPSNVPSHACRARVPTERVSAPSVALAAKLWTVTWHRQTVNTHHLAQTDGEHPYVL